MFRKKISISWCKRIHKTIFLVDREIKKIGLNVYGGKERKWWKWKRMKYSQMMKIAARQPPRLVVEGWCTTLLLVSVSSMLSLRSMEIGFRPKRNWRISKRNCCLYTGVHPKMSHLTLPGTLKSTLKIWVPPFYLWDLILR